jgi:hypothetical protein
VLVAAGIPSVYIVLLLLDSATFLAFAILLTLLPNPRIVHSTASGGYRLAFVTLACDSWPWSAWLWSARESLRCS